MANLLLRRILIIAALLGAATSPAAAQTYLRYTNWCQKGGQRVQMSGQNSSSKVQGSYPGCLVTVYNAGTLVKPFLFSDKLGTPLANPFTASTSDGGFSFYVNAPAHYDVVTSGGGLPAPVSTFDIVLTDIGSGGGGSVTGVTATSPVVSSGGTAPVISLPQATAAQSGFLAAADWATFNAKGAGTVQSVNMTVPTGFSVSGNPVTSTGTLALGLNGQLPPTSLCSGSPTNLVFCNGSGAWLPALTYLGAPVLTLTPGTNIAFTPSGNNLAIASTSAVTFPVAAPEGSQTSAQYAYLLHPEIGNATSLVGDQLPIEQVQVTALVGPSNIIATVSSPINPLRWLSGDTFQLAALPGTSNLNTLNGLLFTATAIAFNQTCPNGYAALVCGTITFSATTTVPVGTYAVTSGSASNYEGFLVGHTWGMNRIQSSTANPARTGTVQGARRDAWVFRCGAADDTGIDCPALRGGVANVAANAIGAGKMRVNGAHSATATSLSINKGAGAWTATSADYILIDRQNGDATVQRYRITNASIVVAANGNTTVTITPPLRTALLGGELIVTQWSRAQLGDGNGAEILGDLTLADLADGCLNIASGVVGTTGVACGAGSAVAGAVNDVQINVASAFGTDTGIFTYTPGTSTLKVRNVLLNGANSQQNRWLYTIGGVALTAGGAGTTVFGVDTDGFFKLCENNTACIRPGTGAGSGNLISSGSPTSGQTAEFITDAFHIAGVANTGTGSYAKATGALLSLPKLDALNDVNNKSALTLVATTNAVDAFTMTNAATANPATVTLSATGSDANINVNIVAKGTGVVQCNGATCGGGGGSSYTNLFQTDANTLTQRNSGVPQIYQMMNTFTDIANYQGMAVGDQFIKTIRAGTGATRALQFGVDNGTVFRGWQVNTGFNLAPFNNVGGGVLASFLQSSSLLDTNGAPFLASTATASAVNSVTIANSIAGQPVQVQATGADANISLNLVSKGTGAVLCNGGSCGSGGGGGSVTTFSAGQLSPLFTTNVTTPTTTPALTFTLISAAANSLFGNNTAAAAAPAYFTAALTALPFGREGTATQVLHGSAAGQFTFAPLNFANDGTGIVPPANLGTGALSSSVFLNGLGQWATPAGGGNVSVTGTTPVNQQAAEWASGTTIRAVNVTGNGSYAKASGPLLVGPLVNTILDANGAPFLAASATASAVDSFTITNSATGNPATVTLGASGSDANIHLLLAPKGTGLTQVNGALQTISSNTGAWQATEGVDPGLAIAGKDLFWAQSGAAHYWTMSNNGGAAQKVIGSSTDLSTADFVIGAHFPAVRAGDIWIKGASGWTNCPGNNSNTQFLTEDSSGNCSWSPGTSSVAWSSLLAPASNTNISMAGFTSTFSYTSALQNSFAWLNTTAATSAAGGTNANSPTLGLQGQVWTGSNISDIWQWQNVLTNGASNGASTLTFTHAGSSGLALLSAPGFKTTSVAASTPHYLSAQATCTGFGSSGNNAICGDSTAWKMSIGGATVVPFVSGPSAATTSGNLASFNVTTGNSVQDSGIAQSQVPTAAAVIASGNVVQGSGGVRGLSDAGYAANTVLTSATVVVNNDIIAGNGARGFTDTGRLWTDLTFASANITTGNIVTGAANTRQVQDGGIALANVFYTGTKADILEAALTCLDAGSTDTYACNLSPVISGYVIGTTYGFKANTANTGTASINFNTRGALVITKLFGGAITSILADNDIRAGQWVYCVYDGINCQMTSQIGNQPSSSGTVTSVATSAPITGGTFTTSGTIGCATCVTAAASLTNNQLVFGAGSQGTAIGDLIGDVTTSGGKTTTIAALAVTTGKLAANAITSAKVDGSVCAPGSYAAQTDAATVTWAIASVTCANASLTFTVHSGSRTLNITNPLNGGSYVLWIKQDGTGGEGLTLGTGCTWKVAGGGAGAVTPSAGANAIDILAFTYDGTNCYATFNKNFN